MKGSIFILVIIFNLILSITGMAFIYMSGEERITVQSEINKTRALYLAEAGIERTKNWFVNLSSEPATVTAFNPFGGEIILEPTGSSTTEGSFIVSVDPDDANPGNIEKKYIITSTGTAGNFSKPVSCIITVINFSRFAYFSDKEYDDTDGAEGQPRNNRIYFTGADIFDGPVHSNDEISICGEPIFAEYNHPVWGPTKQISTSKDFFYYNSGLRADGGSGDPLDLPETASGQYKAVPKIDMYKSFNLNSLENISKDGAPGHYYFNSEKYVEIYEDRIKVGNDTWGTTTKIIPDSGGLAYFKKKIHIRSNIISAGPPKIYGIFDKHLTIVSEEKIEIEGSILCSTASITDGMIGLVANEDIFLSKNAENEIEVDAIMMTYESFYTEDWDTKFKPSSNPNQPAPDKGKLTVIGGFIQRIRKPMGYAYASSYSSELKSGYSKDFRYDKRVLINPPPYFPVSTEVKPLIWKESPANKI